MSGTLPRLRPYRLFSLLVPWVVSLLASAFKCCHKWVTPNVREWPNTSVNLLTTGRKNYFTFFNLLQSHRIYYIKKKKLHWKKSPKTCMSTYTHMTQYYVYLKNNSQYHLSQTWVREVLFVSNFRSKFLLNEKRSTRFVTPPTTTRPPFVSIDRLEREESTTERDLIGPRTLRTPVEVLLYE